MTETTNHLSLMEEQIASSSQVVTKESQVVLQSVEELQKVIANFEVVQTRVHNIQSSVQQTNAEVVQQSYQIEESVHYLEEITEMAVSNQLLASDLKNAFDHQHDEVLVFEQLMDTLSQTSSELQKLVQLNYNADGIDSSLIQTMKQSLEELGKNAQLSILEHSTHEQILNRFMNDHIGLEAIWSNRENGTFIYSNPPAGLVNAQVREWFKHAIKGEVFVSEVYISSLTKRPCITISAPLIVNAQIVGVVGADLSLT